MYNNEEYKPRVIWSILHELGHDRLNHPLDPEQYRNIEIEAHFFAAQIVMPENHHRIKTAWRRNHFQIFTRKIWNFKRSS